VGECTAQEEVVKHIGAQSLRLAGQDLQKQPLADQTMIKLNDWKVT
jgi:hypothetical protein